MKKEHKIDKTMPLITPVKHTTNKDGTAHYMRDSDFIDLNKGVYHNTITGELVQKENWKDALGYSPDNPFAELEIELPKEETI